jgi:hypothetical protein
MRNDLLATECLLLKLQRLKQLPQSPSADSKTEDAAASGNSCSTAFSSPLNKGRLSHFSWLGRPSLFSATTGH